MRDLDHFSKRTAVNEILLILAVDTVALGWQGHHYGRALTR